MKFLSLLLCLVLPVWLQAQPLLPDPGFGHQGASISKTAGWSKEASSLLRQPDGKLLTAGLEYELNNSDFFYQSLLTRFLPDGQPDHSFGTAGSVRLVTGGKNYASAIALQPDGKILVAGNESYIQSGGNPPSAQLLSRAFIARLNPDGSLDAGFGVNGMQSLGLLDAYVSKELYAISVLPDGKIIAAGTIIAAGQQMMLIRLNADGSYDPTFGTSSVGLYSIEAGKTASLWDMTVQDDGRILLAGTTESAALLPPENMVFALARILADGTPDPTFGTQGRVMTQVSSGTGFITDIAHKVMVQPDGKIVLAGAAGSRLALARYLPNGAPDLAFGQGGAVIHAAHPPATGLAWHNGRLYTCGSVSEEDQSLDISISAFTPDGNADLSFAPDGLYKKHLYERNYTHALLIQPDGKIVTGGSFREGNDQGLLLARFTTSAPTGITFGKGTEAHISLYPNPASDQLTISFSRNTATPHGDLSILSVTGQVVYTGKITGQQTTVSTRQLAAGLYVLRIVAGAEMQALKFIKK